ncbi:MAG: cupin domain-containing protein [Xanthobacteraceae bacterium]
MAKPVRDKARPTLDARDAMERLSADASKLHIWLRTEANAPAQRPWFRDNGMQGNGEIAGGRVGAAQLKALPHHWRWSQISPYLDRIAEIGRTADVSPIEFADRQQFLLTNRGLGGRLQVANTIRCAVSIYNPGDIAPVHVHSPNASRTILSPRGGYTNVDGERCEAARGDLILTPNGAWHDHGNDGSDPVIWIDILDFPLMEFLDCVWLDDEFVGSAGGSVPALPAVRAEGYSRRLYGSGGMIPGFVTHQRGFGRKTSPMIHYRGVDTRLALEQLRGEMGDAYEAITLKFVNPATGGPVFPTLDYSAQLLRGGEETWFKRETSATLYVVMEGSGATEIAGQRFNWETNDVFVVPSFMWRRHLNRGKNDAVLYAVSDQPLMEKIGQYRAQGRTPDGAVVELC